MGFVVSALLSSRTRGFPPKKNKKDLTVILNHCSNFIGPQSVLSLEETLCVKPTDSSGSDLSFTTF